MKKSHKIILAVLIALLLAVAGVLYYFIFIAYPLDKDGMIGHDSNASNAASSPAGGEFTVEIALYENASTGFIWEYEMSPSGILEFAEDEYKSDQEDGEEPLDGAGGTHYWRFRVVGSGTVDLHFISKRGTEVLYGSETVYRYRCEDGKAELLENTAVEEVNIDSLSYEWRGGYGTIAGTHPISIVFSGDKVYFNTHFDEYEGKEETDLTRDIEMSQEDIQEIYDLARANLWDIQHNTRENEMVLDAGFEYIDINGESYGGYAPDGKGFVALSRAITDAVGRDRISEFRNEIYEWYGESAFD